MHGWRLVRWYASFYSRMDDFFVPSFAAPLDYGGKLRFLFARAGGTAPAYPGRLCNLSEPGPRLRVALRSKKTGAVPRHLTDAKGAGSR